MSQESIEEPRDWREIIEGILSELRGSCMVDAAFRDKYF
jgi:hypothetical protein